ncbi:MAG TPA: M14 metallopeptidase family protein [Isosphaeraceae bacterium]
MMRLAIALLACVLAAPGPAPARAGAVPSPEEHLGFRPGADGHLAPWPAVVDYLHKVAAASDRVAVRELGRTTEDRPYLVAIVSAPATIRDLPTYRRLQRRLADPRVPAGPGEPADPVAAGKAVVLITCSIHATETASTLMALELLYDLATGDDPATRAILDGTILLLVPSANPDGVDKVAAWYERSRGHPWEGSGMPELYHRYAGHDTNRDWFMLNLRETRLLTGLLYRDWFPTICYDVHEMDGRGPRLFVPPFFDPVNPNIDPRVHQGIAVVGAHMAADLAAAGKRGVATAALYDNWWNGGNRTTPQRHNLVAVLTEAAGVKLATPIHLKPEDLKGGGRGFPDHRPRANFVDPWPGGWWRLRDIVEYEGICARSLLTLAARYRVEFQGRYQAMGRDAIARGAAEPPSAWVVPAGGRDPGTAATLIRVLHDAGIEVHRAAEAFAAEGRHVPAGSWILPAAQPYRAYLKDLMERQAYPTRMTASGEAERPYDVAGWTLPLQMGVPAVALARPPAVAAAALERIEPIRGGIEGPEHPATYVLRNQANDDFLVLGALLGAGVEVTALEATRAVAGGEFPAGALCVPADARGAAALAAVLPRVSSRVVGVAAELRGAIRLRPQRIGVYQPWVPSIDEGWSRLVLERFGFAYATLHDADLRAGDLRRRVDALLIPSIGVRTLRGGFAPGQTEPAYVGGLGDSGLRALRRFVRGGGTLVCLEDSCALAIEELGLPVADVVRGLKTSEFYGPGSILHVTYAGGAEAAGNLLTLGMPAEGSVYFDRSLGFDVLDPDVRVAARYASRDVLESGWLLGPETIQGRAALVEVPAGRGRVILFGFPPQHRGQTHGTFRLLFNALLRGGMTRAETAVRGAEGRDHEFPPMAPLHRNASGSVVNDAIGSDGLRRIPTDGP